MRFELTTLTLASSACTTHRALFQFGASVTQMRLCCFRGASATDHPLVRVKTRIHKYLILLIELAHPTRFELVTSAFGVPQLFKRWVH
jgi:hypothetical protein